MLLQEFIFQPWYFIFSTLFLTLTRHYTLTSRKPEICFQPHACLFLNATVTGHFADKPVHRRDILLDYCNAVLASLPASTLAPFQRVLHAAARTVLDLWLRLFKSCTGCQEIQYKLCLLVHNSLLGHTPEYISDLLTSVANILGHSIYTTRFIVWQPRRRAADTSTNRRRSLFCCYTASMEQAADRAETAVVDGPLSSWSVWFCLRAPGYGLIVGRNTSASVTVTVTR